MRAEEFMQFLIGLMVSVIMALVFYGLACLVTWRVQSGMVLLGCWFLALIGWALMERAATIKEKKRGGLGPEYARDPMIEEAGK